MRAAVVLAVLAACHRGGHAPGDDPRIVVVAAWPGAHVASMERVALPLEDALAKLDGIAHIVDRIEAGEVTIALEPTTNDAFEALKGQIPDALAKAMRQLPEGVPPPNVAWVAPGQQSLFFAGNPTRAVVPRLESRSGVRSVSLCGAPEPAVQIGVDLAKLSALGVGLLDVERAVRESDRAAPGGQIVAGETTLRVAAALRTADDVKQVVVRQADTLVRISDIATVRDGDAPSCFAGTSARAGAFAEVRGAFDKQARAALVQEAVAAGLTPLEALRTERIALDLPAPERDPGLVRAMALAAGGVPNVAWAVARLDADAQRVEIVVGFGDATDAARRTALLAAASAAADAGTAGRAQRPVVARITGIGELEAPLAATAESDANAAVKALRAQGFDAGCAGCELATSIEAVVEPTRTADLGVAATDLSITLALVLAPQSIGTLGERTITLGVDPPPASLADAAPLVRVPSSRLGQIPLSEVVTIHTLTEPREILREDRRRVFLVWARGADPSRVHDALAKALPGAAIRVRD